MPSQQEAYLARRRKMVENQLRARGISRTDLLEAFLTTPRELFVSEADRSRAYEDRPISIGKGQTISQPYVTALMIEQLDPRPTDRVLDVGAGSGYQTGILAALCGHVYAIERIESLTERAVDTLAKLNIDNVTLCTGDGSLGWPEEAPFDGIICGAGVPDVPKAWIDQLADGGRIVVPVGTGDFQEITVVDKHKGAVRRRQVCDVRFVRLIGKEGWPGP